MRTDNRGRWTLKHADLGPDFMALVKKAVLRQGQTVGSFVLDTLRERSQAILKDEAPTHPPPARIETTELAELVRGMAQTQEQRLAQIGREQATRLDAIRRETKRGRWRR
jgi:hypothetical protein